MGRPVASGSLKAGDLGEHRQDDRDRDPDQGGPQGGPSRPIPCQVPGTHRAAKCDQQKERSRPGSSPIARADKARSSPITA